MIIFKQLFRNRSLPVVNLIGLSIMFACLLLSLGYVKQEFSYDRHHSNAENIVRLSVQVGDQPADGRVLGNFLDNHLSQLSEIEQVVKIFKISDARASYKGENLIINNFYGVTEPFLDIFDLPILHSNRDEIFKTRGDVLISESFAKKLAGESGNNIAESVLESVITFEGELDLTITGIYKNIPNTSHFQTDILAYRSAERAEEGFTYLYLLLKENTDLESLSQNITNYIEQNGSNWWQNSRAVLTPITDIHLYSNNLREMEVNGNIYYIYLIIGANLLLLIVVLFNFWLNTSLISTTNQRYYQMIRLYGAPKFIVIKNEIILALVVGAISIILGLLWANMVQSFNLLSIKTDSLDILLLSFIYLILIVLVSLLPTLKNITYNLLVNRNKGLKPTTFSYSNVKWMLTIQYAVVMIVVILAVGVNRQMNLIKETQVGGDEENILVIKSALGTMNQEFNDYAVLKENLLKNPQIESFTSSFQVPGDAIRDALNIKRTTDNDWKMLPMLVVGEEFLPFFNIELLAGKGFGNSKFSYKAEEELFYHFMQTQESSSYIEEYIINRKALTLLGFNTPDEAIGEVLQISQGSIDYINKGVIVGVTDNFNYTGVFEENFPILIMQRNLFQFNAMVKFAPNHQKEAKAIFDEVWNKIYPNYPANFTFISNIFNEKYRNEIYAQQLIYIFSLLSFSITILGLIVFVAFIIRKRTREIAIRKTYGATIRDIILMLNLNFMRYIAVAFMIAAPTSWYIMHQWLKQFSHKISIDWWLFLMAGSLVLVISFITTLIQAWRAATLNPVKGIVK